MTATTSLIIAPGNTRFTMAAYDVALRDAGFAPQEAGTLADVLQQIARMTSGVVVTGDTLPDASVRQILTALRACPLAVIVVSPTGADRAVEEAFRLGAFHAMSLPASPYELVSICRVAVASLALTAKANQLDDLIDERWLDRSRRPQRSCRPERAVIERAAFTRLATFVDEAIAKASTQVLEDALSRTGSSEALKDIVSEVLVQDAADGKWAAALLRGAEVQRDLLTQAGGALSAVDVGKVLGITRAAVDKRRRQGALLGIKLPSGDIAYPAAQFRKGDVVPGLPEVLQAFHIRDPWMQLDTLLAADETLGGRSAFEALAKGEVEGVKASVSSYGEPGL